MATPRILIDTSIFIEYLRKQNKAKSILYQIVESQEIYTSTVVEFELYAGATDEQKRRDVDGILTWCTVVPFTSDIAQTAAIIYQELKSVNRLIDMRDILIAASALTHGLPVMTLNMGHFDRVTGLQLVSPPFSRA